MTRPVVPTEGDAGRLRLIAQAVAARRPTLALADLRRRHPEWPVLLLAAAAWVPLFVPAVNSTVAHWVLMTLAMMLPVIASRIRTVARACEPAARLQACATTVAGFLLIWLVAGAITVVITTLLPPVTSADQLAFLAVWWMGALWQLTPLRSHAIQRCHRVRMARGRRTNQWMPGMRYGRWCVAACYPAMAAMILTRAPAVVMAILAVALVAERNAFRPRRGSRGIAVGMIAWASAELALKMIGGGLPAHQGH